MLGKITHLLSNHGSDVDECLSNTSNNCSPDALCQNTDGSFRCECMANHTGNGTFCRGTKCAWTFTVAIMYLKCSLAWKMSMCWLHKCFFSLTHVKEKLFLWIAYVFTWLYRRYPCSFINFKFFTSPVSLILVVTFVWHSAWSAITCNHLPSVPNGHVIVNSRLVHGTAQYSCNSGYNLLGNSLVQCLMNETWSGAAPTCSGELVHKPNPIKRQSCSFNIHLFLKLNIHEFLYQWG